MFEINYNNAFIKQIESVKDKKILLYGASLFLEDFLENNPLSEQNILAIADINKTRWGEYLGKYKIVSPDEIKNLKPDVIIITIQNINKKNNKILLKRSNKKTNER